MSKTGLFTGQKIQNAEKTSFAICLIKMLKMHRFFAEKGYNFVKQYAYFFYYLSLFYVILFSYYLMEKCYFCPSKSVREKTTKGLTC